MYVAGALAFVWARHRFPLFALHVYLAQTASERMALRYREFSMMVFVGRNMPYVLTISIGPQVWLAFPSAVIHDPV